MKLSLLLPAAALLAAFAPSSAFAQGPDGSDVNKAIPIYFGQVVDDILDVNTGSGLQVYKITLAKGQKVTIGYTTAVNKKINLCLFPPSTISVKNGSCIISVGSGGGNSYTALTIPYDVATAGTYYIQTYSYDPATRFQLQVNATGTPVAVPNPPTAGCLSGRVDYITYSLQLIAAGLPDELSIGGTKVSASSIVKPPLYPEIVNRLENALRSKVNVETCYDASGNIFQIKLVQP